MNNIKVTVAVDHSLLLLKERDRLGHCIDEKRKERLELETAKRQATDEDATSVIQDHINRLLLEIESLQIDFLNIYKQNNNRILDSCLTDNSFYPCRRAIPSHVPDLPGSGDIVLKAMDAMLIEGVSVMVGESFSAENGLARQLIDAGRVIVDERYILS
jgi:hypothetical protein